MTPAGKDNLLVGRDVETQIIDGADFATRNLKLYACQLHHTLLRNPPWLTVFA
jgi:hypothetical protein